MRALSLAFLIAASLLAAPAVKTGPAVGEAIPAISLADQDGRIRTLSDIAGPKGAMLVFHRSADW